MSHRGRGPGLQGRKPYVAIGRFLAIDPPDKRLTGDAASLQFSVVKWTDRGSVCAPLGVIARVLLRPAPPSRPRLLSEVP